MLALATSALTVQLRALADTDLALYQALYTDAQTMQFIGPCLTEEQSARSFRAALAPGGHLNGQRFLVAELGEPPHAIGLCGLSLSVQGAELGIILLRQFRGSGIARATVSLLVNHTFEQFTGDWICVDYGALNLRAARLFAALGFLARNGFAAKNPTRSLAWLARRQWQQARFNH